MVCLVATGPGKARPRAVKPRRRSPSRAPTVSSSACRRLAWTRGSDEVSRVCKNRGACMGLLRHIVGLAINNMPTHAGLVNHIILIFLSISWGSVRSGPAIMRAPVAVNDRLLFPLQRCDGVVEHGVDQRCIRACAERPAHDQPVETVNHR